LPTVEATALPPSGRSLAPAALLRLQATFGNGHVQRMLSQSVARAPDEPKTAKPKAGALDATAQAIVDAAQNDKTPIATRATALVNAIIRDYYGDQATKVKAVTYQASQPGLETESSGKGAAATGTILVGDYFVTHADASGFARRVLQVGHELQHIDQWRAGLAGANKRHEREFLAFYWEAMAPARAGTGKVSHSTRINLIDGALGHLMCLDDRGRFATQEKALLKEREAHEGGSGRDATPVPTECKG
jgi:hypothetical protein